MHPILKAVLADGPALTDGAWGTQLQALGLALGESSDGWNLTHPALVERVAQAYHDAGSLVILSNTFGANRLALARHGLADRAKEINRSGIGISRRVLRGRGYAFASMGPTGVLLAAGEGKERAVAEAFSEQASALADAGAHGLVIETMSDLSEAVLAVEAARPTGLPVVACLSFDSGKNKDRTMMGVTPEQAAEALTKAGADVIGANCGQGGAGYISIAKRLRTATDRPIWMKPNAGLPVMEAGKTVYRTTPETFVAEGLALRDAGASFVGGCCGTTPDLIRALKARW